MLRGLLELLNNDRDALIYGISEVLAVSAPDPVAEELENAMLAALE